MAWTVRIAVCTALVAGCGRVAFDPLPGDGGASDDVGDAADDAAAPVIQPWLVGNAGTICRWDGAAWQPVASPTPADLYEVYAPREDAAWAAGDTTLLQWDGVKWTAMAAPVSGVVTGLFGRNADDVYLASVSGSMAHWNGSSWNTFTGPAATTVNAMTGTPTELYLVGDLAEVWRYDGAWKSETLGTINDIEEIHAFGTDLYGVGEHATLFQRSGTWTNPMITGDRFLRDVRVFASNDIWIVGELGTSLHYNGTSWAPFATGLPNTTELWTVWGETSDDVWAGGNGGAIIHWDGVKWSSVPGCAPDTIGDIGR